MNLVIAGTTIIVAGNVITFRERDEKERTKIVKQCLTPEYNICNTSYSVFNLSPAFSELP